MVGKTPCWSLVCSSLAEYHSMIKVYFLFSTTTDYAIAAIATIDDKDGVFGKVYCMPDRVGNVNVTVNITGLTGMWNY